MNKNQRESVGIGYSRKSKQGKPYVVIIAKENLTLEDGTELLIFPRTKPKQKDSDPDFTVLLGEERQSKPAARQRQSSGGGDTGGFPF